MSSDAPIRIVAVDELAELIADRGGADLIAEILRLGRISRVHLPEPAPRLGDYATAEEFLAAHNGPRDPEPHRPARTAPLALTAGAGAPAEAPDLPRATDEIERTDSR
jgi:hypothetical protein